MTEVVLPHGFRVKDRLVWEELWEEAVKKLQAAAPQHGQIAGIDLRLPLNVTSLQTAIAGIRDTTVPKPPCFHALLQANKKWTTADMDDVLSRTQKYISGLGYNHLGEAFFDVTKSAGASRIMVLAKEIIHQSLPIKCLEAVVVAAYLTMGIQALDRIPLAFESQAGGNTYRHIVLVVRHRPRPGQSLWGALGLSRRKTLMDKPCHYESLASLVWDYRESYEAVTHKLPFCWYFQDIAMDNMDRSELTETLDGYTRRLR